MNFYRVLIESTVNNQTISNVLYFGRDDGGSPAFDPVTMQELLVGVQSQLMTAYAQCMSNSVTTHNLKATLVSETNVNVSFFDINAPLALDGELSSAIDGNGPAAILGFSCTPFDLTQAYRVPKRSYLAIGPVSGGYVGSTGQLGSTLEGLLATLGQAIVDFNFVAPTSGVTFISVRVGVANSAGLGSAGRIAQALVRPYVSFRRSRMTSPSGS